MVKWGLCSRPGVDICSAFTGPQGPGEKEWARAAGTMGARGWEGQSGRGRTVGGASEEGTLWDGH